MPRVGVDLCDIDRRREVHAETTAGTAGTKENIRARLVFVARQPSVDERRQFRASLVQVAVDQRQLRVRARIVFNRRRDRFELKLASRGTTRIALKLHWRQKQ